jgi:hypothetical protein
MRRKKEESQRTKALETCVHPLFLQPELDDTCCSAVQAMHVQACRDMCALLPCSSSCGQLPPESKAEPPDCA